jgi:macrophage erythroblast attacher
MRILKRKSNDLRNDEKDYLKLIKRRIEHLKEHDTNTLATLKSFKKQRMDRMLIDYFLRSGFYNTAQLLANKSKILEMTNIDVFLTEKDIVNSLKNKDSSKCLTWCNDNKSKLKKINVSCCFEIFIP